MIASCDRPGSTSIIALWLTRLGAAVTGCKAPYVDTNGVCSEAPAVCGKKGEKCCKTGRACDGSLQCTGEGEAKTCTEPVDCGGENETCCKEGPACDGTLKCTGAEGAKKCTKPVDEPCGDKGQKPCPGASHRLPACCGRYFLTGDAVDANLACRAANDLCRRLRAVIVLAAQQLSRFG